MASETIREIRGADYVDAEMLRKAIVRQAFECDRMKGLISIAREDVDRDLWDLVDLIKMLEALGHESHWVSDNHFEQYVTDMVDDIVVGAYRSVRDEFPWTYMDWNGLEDEFADSFQSHIFLGQKWWIPK